LSNFLSAFVGNISDIDAFLLAGIPRQLRTEIYLYQKRTSLFLVTAADIPELRSFAEFAGVSSEMTNQ